MFRTGSRRKAKSIAHRKSKLHVERLEIRQLLASDMGLWAIDDAPAADVGLLANSASAMTSPIHVAHHTMPISSIEESSISYPDSDSNNEYIKLFDLPTEVADPFSTPPNQDGSHDLMNLDLLRADPRFQDVDGRGLTAVIIDSGIDLDHSFFGDDLNGDGVSDRIAFSYDFSGDNDADATDFSGHGSHVTSTVGSSDSAHPGVAPAVNLIHLKVFPDDPTGEATAAVSDIEEALQWVVENATSYNVASVNLSLGAGNFSSLPNFDVHDEFQQLASQNVIITASAGNDFFGKGSVPGVSWPAVEPSVISVGAVWNNFWEGEYRWEKGSIDHSTGIDRIVSFSQRHESLTDIFAPGAEIVSAWHDGGTKLQSGTSQASPQVAGAAVLAQQLSSKHLGRRLTVDEFRQVLSSSAVTIHDGDDEDDNVVNTGLEFKRIDIYEMALEILRLADSVAPDGSVVVNGGESLTNSQIVTVDVTATDDLLGVADVRFAVNKTADTDFGEWQPFEPTDGTETASFEVKLPSHQGTNWVNAQIRDHAGNIRRWMYDSIVLDTVAPKGQIEISSRNVDEIVQITDKSGEIEKVTRSQYLDVSLADVSDIVEGNGSPAEDLTVRYSINGAWHDWQSYAPQISLPRLNYLGKNWIVLQVQDEAGNFRTFYDSIILDRSIPTATFDVIAGQAGTVFEDDRGITHATSRDVLIVLGAIDNVSASANLRFSYKINSTVNDADWRSFSGNPISIRLNNMGTNWINLWIQDEAGNVRMIYKKVVLDSIS